MPPVTRVLPEPHGTTMPHPIDALVAHVHARRAEERVDREFAAASRHTGIHGGAPLLHRDADRWLVTGYTRQERKPCTVVIDPHELRRQVAALNLGPDRERVVLHRLLPVDELTACRTAANLTRGRFVPQTARVVPDSPQVGL